MLKNPAYHFKRIGLEAGPLSQWLFSALAEAELPVVCVETRHMQAVLKAQINKTDRNDARGIAQMMRAGLYRPVHVKTLRSQKLRMLLTHRKLLQSKAIAIENDLRGTLRNFGLKVGMVGKVKFEARIKELVENFPDLAELVEPLLIVRRVLREQIVILHQRLLAIVRDDEVCRRLMTTPGVGPVVALTYRATVDVPARFRKSKAVGAVFGLTCSKYQSGEIDWSGRISRCGDEMMRVVLYEAAQVMLTRTTKWSWLKAWAMQIARRRGIKKAIDRSNSGRAASIAKSTWMTDDVTLLRDFGATQHGPQSIAAITTVWRNWHVVGARRRDHLNSLADLILSWNSLVLNAFRCHHHCLRHHDGPVLRRGAMSDDPAGCHHHGFLDGPVLRRHNLLLITGAARLRRRVAAVTSCRRGGREGNSGDG